MSVLAAYLKDHFAGAASGKGIAELCIELAEQEDHKVQLRTVLEDIKIDERTLRRVMDAAGVRPNPLKRAGAAAGVIPLRLKCKIGPAPLGPILATEALMAGIQGKRGLWSALETRPDPNLTRFKFADLAARAEDQLARVTRVHDNIAAQNLR